MSYRNISFDQRNQLNQTTESQKHQNLVFRFFCNLKHRLSRDTDVSERGQSLIEVLVGLATAVFIMGAITAATISALNNSVYSKNQNLATGYAQQGIEIVRNLRDRNYTLFNEMLQGAQHKTYCLAKTCDKIDPTSSDPSDPCGPKQIQCSQNVGGQNADIFVREVTVDTLSPYCQETQNNQTTQGTYVTTIVSWYDSKCANASTLFCHSVQLSTCLSTYNAVSSQ